MSIYRNRSQVNTLRLTQTAILVALTAILTFFSLKIGMLEITLAIVPVTVGAVILGVRTGAILGSVFGVCSYIMCFGMSPFGAALLALDPFCTFLVCVPTRVLAGVLAAVIFRVIDNGGEKAKRKIVAVYGAGIAGAVLNTVFFMATLIALFLHTDLLQGICATDGTLASLLALVASLAGVNAIVEAIAGCLLSGTISMALLRAQRSSH